MIRRPVMWEYLPRPRIVVTDVFDMKSQNEIKSINKMNIKHDMEVMDENNMKNRLTITDKEYNEMIKEPHMFLTNENPYLPWYLKQGHIIFRMPKNNDGSTSIIFFPSKITDKIYKYYH